MVNTSDDFEADEDADADIARFGPAVAGRIGQRAFDEDTTHLRGRQPPGREKR